jgi:hypothetical protein
MNFDGGVPGVCCNNCGQTLPMVSSFKNPQASFSGYGALTWALPLGWTDLGNNRHVCNLPACIAAGKVRAVPKPPDVLPSKA